MPTYKSVSLLYSKAAANNIAVVWMWNLDSLKSDEGSVDGSGNMVFEENTTDIMDREEN